MKWLLQTLIVLEIGFLIGRSCATKQRDEMAIEYLNTQKHYGAALTELIKIRNSGVYVNVEWITE